RPVETPSADDAPGRAPSPSPCGGTARRMDGLIDGATTTMLVLKRLTAAAVTIGALITGGLAGLFTGLGAAWAGDGQPSPWQFGFQSSATPVMDKIVEFHTFLLYTVTAIALFVLVLLVIVAVRFNARANPTPSRTTHNPVIEVIWTVVPV